MSSSDEDVSNRSGRSPDLSRAARVTSEQDDPKFRSMAMGVPMRPPPIGGAVYRSAPIISGGGVSPLRHQKALERPKSLGSPKNDLRAGLNDDIRADIRLDTEISGSKLDDVHGRPPSNWLVKQDSLRAVPTYYPLEKSSRYISGGNVEDIAHKISDCCRIMSVQADFDDNMGTASLRTAEHVEIQVSLWQGTAPRYPDCIIVEAQRRRGDAVTYHKYCRNILDAADGAFDPEHYKLMEQKELEYCKKAEDMLHHGKKPATKGNTEYENSMLALEIAASLLKKDRMDARQLGMESLCLLTDPIRTGTETALLTSRVVLLGTTQDENVDDDEDACDEWGIREAILSLVQFGRLGEDGDFGADQDIDSDDEDAAAGHPEEKQHNDMLHNLALAVLANALEVLENHGKRIASGTESPSSVANTFLNESKEMMDRDLLSTLLNKLGNADSKPHDACLSAQCLRSLCQASKDARRRARELKAKQIVMTALDVGRRTHVKLEAESQKVIVTLAKADDDVQQE